MSESQSIIGNPNSSDDHKIRFLLQYFPVDYQLASEMIH